MLSTAWEQRSQRYDFVIVGSGYGGPILAARISGAAITPKPSVCLLERGREWPVGTFPDTFEQATAAFRDPLVNPLGLYELRAFADISVIQGGGLGGTSLVNANVALAPDAEDSNSWPGRGPFDSTTCNLSMTEPRRCWRLGRIREPTICSRYRR
jgi:cholesterol oxidase